MRSNTSNLLRTFVVFFLNNYPLKRPKTYRVKVSFLQSSYVLLNKIKKTHPTEIDKNR